MDKEFHYWVTGIVANRAGFNEDEARIIAYSSQYVDDNDVKLAITNRSTGKIYRNFISQTMNIFKPQRELMQIYPIFHFIPGEPLHNEARRCDGKLHILNTTPDNENANKFLSDAFKSAEDTRLYRIGIASHAYADTWAHQNFIGWDENFNAHGINILPNIGHADVQHNPDRISLKWNDIRLVNHEIDNNHRFLSAAKRLFRHYCDFMISQKRCSEEHRQEWEQLERELSIIFNQPNGDPDFVKEQRMSCFKRLAPWLPEYNETTWFNNAVETKVRGLRDSFDKILSVFTFIKDEFYWREDKRPQSTDWFKFQKAVKAHERFALDELSDLYKQMNIDIRKAELKYHVLRRAKTVLRLLTPSVRLRRRRVR